MRITSEIPKIYTIWLREVKRYFREKSRIITSIVTPLLWLLIFGTGMRFSAKIEGGVDYQLFIFPGILGMNLLFTSIWSGISVLWDREFGFMKEILVAPVSRTSIVVGKALGGGTSALIQGSILLCIGAGLGIPISLTAFLICLPLMLIISVGLVSIGLLIASMIESLEGFNLIMSFVNMPMFFLSGALFPLTTAPSWVHAASFVNPLTYSVDALRTVILGSCTQFPIFLDISVIIGFAIVMILLCAVTFGIRK